MPVSTKKQIRDACLGATSQTNAQIGTLVDDFINITLNEINNPAWAFRGEGQNHLWSWLKRKTTFPTVSGTTDYLMERDVDRIASLKPTNLEKLSQVPDEIFNRDVITQTATGNPRLYRIWEVNGLSTKLSAADTISVVSSSAIDGTSFTVSIIGYINGRLDSEVLTLNGTTTVTGTKSWDARSIFVSKSGVTTGNLTVKAVSATTTLLTLGREETSPRFKVVSLFPIPGSVLTMNVEYYKAIRELVNDSDAPEFGEKWHHVVRLGTIPKIYQLLGKSELYVATQEIYAKAVRGMVSADKANPDLIETLRRDKRAYGTRWMRDWTEDVINP